MNFHSPEKILNSGKNVCLLVKQMCILFLDVLKEIYFEEHSAPIHLFVFSALCRLQCNQRKRKNSAGDFCDLNYQNILLICHITLLFGYVLDLYSYSHRRSELRTTKYIPNLLRSLHMNGNHLFHAFWLPYAWQCVSLWSMLRKLHACYWR